MMEFSLKEQKSLWDSLRKSSTIRFFSKEEYENRENIVRNLENEVNSGRYSVRPITGFLTAPKGNGVARFVPVFSFEDVIVFFTCIRKFDKILAEKAVPYTFGGWSLGGKRRKFEEENAHSLFKELQYNQKCSNYDPIYTPSSSLNPQAWFKNWQQYWKILAAFWDKAEDNNYFLIFDIANFYDSIDLPKLERQLRGVVSNSNFEIEVMFFILSTWNKGINEYARTSKGIPQDVIGDCSRVLANFYLTQFDEKIRDIAINKKSNYIRYADDMVLCCPNEQICKEILFIACELLHKIGLNVNSSKVLFLSKKEFNNHWQFHLMDTISNQNTVIDGVRYLQKQWIDNDNYKRKDTAIRACLANIRKIHNKSNTSTFEVCQWIHEKILKSNHLIFSLKSNHIDNLIAISDNPQETLLNLSDIIIGTHYSQTQCELLHRLLKFKENNKLCEIANKKIEELKEINNPIINLTLKNSSSFITTK